MPGDKIKPLQIGASTDDDNPVQDVHMEGGLEAFTDRDKRK